MTKKKAVSAPVRRRVFTAEFKLEMVRQFAVRRAQGASQAQVARELDLSVPMLHSWVRTFATTNLAWVGDMTYIPTRAGWLYLAVLLDLASRRVVGWAVGTTLATRLPLTALQRARAARQPAAGLIQHTDRGSQDASDDYRAVLRAHGHRAAHASSR